jgi:hypothetical protein
VSGCNHPMPCQNSLEDFRSHTGLASGTVAFTLSGHCVAVFATGAKKAIHNQRWGRRHVRQLN